MINLIKATLAILLFLCVLKMPYGYYEFVRFVAMVGFAFLAFESSKKNEKNTLITYVVLALLFQPFFKIALGRGLWNIVDIIVGLGLLLSIFINHTDKNSSENRSKDHQLID